jgi:hypothetical protein
MYVVVAERGSRVLTRVSACGFVGKVCQAAVVAPPVLPHGAVAPRRTLMLVKLFVGNLSWSIGDDELARFFADHGDVQSARVITDRDTGRSRGFGFVEIEVENVANVIRATDGQDLNGRPIRVNESEDRNRGGRGGNRGGGGYGRY